MWMKLSINNLFDVFQTTRLWLIILRVSVLFALIWGASSQDSWFFWWLLPLAYLGVVLWAVYDHLSHPLRFFSALVLDISVIALVLMLSDGVMSGWVSFLILPALIGCLSLSRLYAWLVALFSVVCYGVLIWFSAEPGFLFFGDSFSYGALSGGSVSGGSVSAGSLSGEGTHPSHTLNDGHTMADMQQHMWGMWLTFSISITLMTGFLVQQRSVANAYQLSMIKLQQQFAREQQIMALAGLTANTTHQLASPISTARLLVEEMLEDALCETEKNRNLQLVEQQLSRCTTILDNMMTQTETTTTDESEAVEFVPWFKEVLHNWWNGHNEIKLRIAGESECGRLQVQVDQNLTFAFNNVFDNISRALLTDDQYVVEVVLGAVAKSTITIEIRYYGEPPSGDVIEFLGKRIVKSQDGMGIGALLAQTAIERLDGSLEYFWYDNRRCTVSILLPVLEGEGE